MSRAPSVLRRAFTVACLAGGGSLTACEIVAGLAMPDLVEPAVAIPEAGPPDAGEGVEASAASCDPVVPTRRPEQPGAELPALTFAVEYVAAAAESEIPGDALRLCATPAIDLDGIATCSAAADGGALGGSCKPRKNEACDTVGGGDNAAATSVAFLLGSKASPEDDPNTALRAGTSGLLVEVVGYNGADDDSTVAVALLYAAGVSDDAGAPGASPRNDGTDVWLAERASFRTDDTPRYIADDAYVSHGVLVARFEKVPFTFGGSASRVEAAELIMTGQLVRPAPGEAPTRLDRGRLGARVAFDTIWTYAGGRLANGEPLCKPGSLQRAALVQLFCGGADLVRTAGGFSPDAPCDAISYAAGFYATRARRGTRPYDGDAGVLPPRTCPYPEWPPTCAEVGL